MKTRRCFVDAAACVAGVLTACSLLMGANDECDNDNCDPGFWDSNNSNDGLDGIECEHGPRHDRPNCKMCWRIEDNDLVPGSHHCCETDAGQLCRVWDDANDNGDVDQGEVIVHVISDCEGERPEGALQDPPLTPVCECFDCTKPANPKCEGQIFIWFAHCGIFDNDSEGECDTHIPAHAAEQVVRYEIPWILKQGVATCSGRPGSTDQRKRKYVCGSGHTIDYADCITKDCEPDPDFDGVDPNDPEECERGKPNVANESSVVTPS